MEATVKHVPAVAAFVGSCAVVAGLYGLAGAWWALVLAGVLLVAWAVLASKGAS